MRKTLREKLRDDAATFKTLPKSERREFIWDYYKVPIIAAASVVVLVIITVFINFGRGDTVMYAVLINAGEDGDPKVFDAMLADAGVDMSGKSVDVASRYTIRYDDSSTDGETVLVLAALFGVGDLDVFAADERVFESYAVKDAFVDLALFIPREELDRHRLYLHTGADGKEIVAGVWLSEGSPLHEAGYFSGDVVIGVAALAQNIDPAVEFMKELVKRI